MHATCKQSFQPATHCAPGRSLTIADGRVKINFQSGAKLVLEAPAELRLLGPNSAQLERGVVTVRVPW